MWPIRISDDSVVPAVKHTKNFTLWEAGNVFIESAREVQSNHMAWVAANGPTALSNNRYWMFVLDNMEALYVAYGEVLDKLVMRAMASVQVGIYKLLKPQDVSSKLAWPDSV